MLNLHVSFSKSVIALYLNCSVASTLTINFSSKNSLFAEDSNFQPGK